jgi:TIR domain
VFLSYNSLDRAVVERVAKELNQRKCSCFIDRWYLLPGRDWVEALERSLAESQSVAVCVGPHDIGRWQQRERAWALDRQVADPEFAVIPVLLPGGEPPLGFLRCWCKRCEADAQRDYRRRKRAKRDGTLMKQILVADSLEAVSVAVQEQYNGDWNGAIREIARLRARAEITFTNSSWPVCGNLR